ncbi:MAG: SAM-dependent methyltransferase [Bacteroidales bacterium]|nr:SAM-dependent methyltransferase [Bacteroidales bacterium]
MKTPKGTLFLLPSPLGENISEFFFTDYYIQRYLQIKIFIVEEIRTARRFLRKLVPNFPIDTCTFLIYNEHTLHADVQSYIQPLLHGQDVGLMSEAGCPIIADPGHAIVREAHKNEIKVVPYIGPSSILLALMASGLPSQTFKFNGYLPAKSTELIKVIQKIEKESKLQNLTQIFIETPYRNQSLLDCILKHCTSHTLLSVACNLTQPDEFIYTQTIENWRKNCNNIPKKPAVFLLYSGKL